MVRIIYFQIIYHPQQYVRTCASDFFKISMVPIESGRHRLLLSLIKKVIEDKYKNIG